MATQVIIAILEHYYYSAVDGNTCDHCDIRAVDDTISYILVVADINCQHCDNDGVDDFDLEHCNTRTVGAIIENFAIFAQYDVSCKHYDTFTFDGIICEHCNIMAYDAIDCRQRDVGAV